MKTGLVKYAADETLFNYKTIKFFDPAPPKYIYIHCPQLVSANYISLDKDKQLLNTYNIVSCFVNNSSPN